ncbi:MAG: hypothetical protein OXI67_14935 [Candidatus Poribacteria bacterium]|nr:hypothetical protein [Candidatus Poribacteria bacterium]
MALGAVRKPHLPKRIALIWYKPRMCATTAVMLPSKSSGSVAFIQDPIVSIYTLVHTLDT